MPSIPAYFALQANPEADPECVVEAGSARFSILTPRLIRLEFSPGRHFTNQPSQVFWQRRMPLPNFYVRRETDEIEIETEKLCLRYRPELGFQPQGLQIELKDSGLLWQLGDPPRENLGGTVRTLDMRDGPVPLDPGLLSRLGWTLVDDSRSLLFNQAGWLELRPVEAGAKDLYFFGYGLDYDACLRDFFQVSGPVPLIPRWALGNWWSRYWAYSQEELGRLMLDFQAQGVPLGVCIIDMDWHITDTGNDCSGWTGFTWNRELFPDPPGFLKFLHSLGLKSALNLHPAEGIHSHEAVYPALAQAVGIDPATRQPVAYDPTDPDFMMPYFELVHHAMEAEGVDFWWMDWQQGNPTRLADLNLLWWINHIYFRDSGRSSDRRPFIFSRWGGLGNHRYPIGFSGDTTVSWRSLAFQPYFTATAANVGFSWWSHDIGGHMGGFEDPELFVRWVQSGVFSPIMRLHSTNNPYHERRPWGFDAETERVTGAALRLRHRLIPYLYTAAWRNHIAGEALVRPLYHLAPDREAAYACPTTTTFGRELLTAPFTQPADPDTRLTRQVVWLPPGDWFDFFSGQWYAGDGWHTLYGGLEDIPVLARAGAIVPLGPDQGWNGLGNPDEIELRVFPGAGGEFRLYEDDGESQAYQTGNSLQTPYRLLWGEETLRLVIDPPEGDLSLIPDRRRYHIRFLALKQPTQILTRYRGEPIAVDWQYEPRQHTLLSSTVELGPAGPLEVEVRTVGSLLERDPRLLPALERLLKYFRMESEAKLALRQALPSLVSNPGGLARAAGALSGSQLWALLETITGCGAVRFDQTGREQWVLWNNRQDPQFAYHFSQEQQRRWRPEQRFTGESGIVPTILVLDPEAHTDQGWWLRASYAGIVSKVFGARTK
jgi:hypothetical protein